MSLLLILFIILIVWLIFKIGFQAFKWFLILATAVIVYWFLTAGGGIEFKKPSNMPELSKSLTSPIR